MNTAPTPVALKGDSSGLRIEWSDGIVHQLSWRLLRQRCPCATCRVAKDKPAPLLGILKPEEALPVKGTGMEPLGNYAYHIDFSDGHNSGIYSLDLLRTLGEESA